MTIRSNYNSQTLDEYLQSVKRRVETGNAPPSGIFLELTHFARLYRHANDNPAEPGGTAPFPRKGNAITLQDIDELRALIAGGREKTATTLVKLEELAAKVGLK